MSERGLLTFQCPQKKEIRGLRSEVSQGPVLLRLNMIF